MAHEIHHTGAFILSKIPSRDADAILSLFTEAYGRIEAVAISVREEKSKLRYALQPWVQVRVALVQGKELWRVTGAEVLREYLFPSPRHKHIFMQLCVLVRRLVHGGGHHTELYELLEEVAARLEDESLSEEEVEALERIAALRICSVLGYAGAKKELEPFLEESTYSTELLELSLEQKTLLITHINESLHASHL